MPDNIAEGSYSRGGNRNARYHDALGSARETWACLQVAERFGYIEKINPQTVERLRCIIGTLVKIVC